MLCLFAVHHFCGRTIRVSCSAFALLMFVVRFPSLCSSVCLFDSSQTMGTLTLLGKLGSLVAHPRVVEEIVPVLTDKLTGSRQISLLAVSTHIYTHIPTHALLFFPLFLSAAWIESEVVCVVWHEGDKGQQTERQRM